MFSVSLFFSFFVFLFPRQIFASAEFLTDYQVTYEASREGKMLVTQDITLTNKLSNIYATQYTFSLERNRPENLSASGEQGPLETQVQSDQEKTVINVKFDDQVVGKGKTRKFTLRYEMPDILTHSGQVWEIALPKIESAESIDNYSLTLIVPSFFGKPAFISPSPQSQQTENEKQIFTFAKNEIAKTGVVSAFGAFQVFDFSLTYHLTNSDRWPIKTKIALPPETAYQKITYRQINPQPENIEVDPDGNWLGIYRLEGNEALVVEAEGQVKLFANPRREYPLLFSKNNLDTYLEASQYWEADNPEIKKLAQTLRTPEEIHKFVVGKLDYDYSRVREGAKRMGAQAALFQPERAICMEYTDLFIALARAAGIPARELNGYAFTTNPYLQPLSLVQDILHAWPEYWDSQKNTWVQIDPTWQDTTGGLDYFSKTDLGHFVFVIHGESPVLPLPAGAYKDKSGNKKDIRIAVGQYQESPPPRISIDFVFPSQIPTERESTGKILLKSPGGEALYNLPIEIKTENLRLLSRANEQIEILPPFSSREIPLHLSTPGFFSRGRGKVTILANKQQFEYNIAYESFVIWNLLPILGGLALTVFALILVRQAIFKFRRKTSNKPDDQEKPFKESSPTTRSLPF